LVGGIGLAANAFRRLQRPSRPNQAALGWRSPDKRIRTRGISSNPVPSSPYPTHANGFFPP
jgi:hypothetical protein